MSLYGQTVHPVMYDHIHIYIHLSPNIPSILNYSSPGGGPTEYEHKLKIMSFYGR